MQIKNFYDEATSTLTYVIWDEGSKDSIVIDPVLDYQPESGEISTQSYDLVAGFIKRHNLNLRLVLETHAHADHLSASQLFKRDFPEVRVGIGSQITEVQQVFHQVFNLTDQSLTDGSQFDFLITAYEPVNAGTIVINPLPTPGHTPACLSYLIEDAVFTGDALFMPDFGTGRCDFPKGSASDLYHSVTEVLYKLPDSTRVFVGHDYRPGGRELRYESSISEQKSSNKQLNMGVTREDFISFRQERDAGLNAPKLLYPSVQVNIEAGRLPAAESNGTRYLKTPLSGKI